MGDGFLAVEDHVLLSQGEAEPATEHSGAHGGVGFLEAGQERALDFAIAESAFDFQGAEGVLVDLDEVGAFEAGEFVYVSQGGLLSFV